MDKQLAQQILEYLDGNTGTPLTSNEIASSISQDPVLVDNALKQLHTLGYTYTVQSGYWYLTLPGKKVAMQTLKLNAKGTPEYSKIQSNYETLTPEKRQKQFDKDQESYKALEAELRLYYKTFQNNHPEYNKLYKFFETSPANKQEFFKDVHAMLLSWDVGKHQILRYPEEKAYTYPATFTSVEQAMDESIRRYYKFVSADRDKIIFQDEYKKTLIEVDKQIQTIAALISNDYLKKQAAGTIVNFADIRAWLNDQLASLKLPKGTNKELFFEVLFQRIPKYIAPTTVVFLNTTPEEVIVTTLINSLRTKNGVQIFNRTMATVHNSSVSPDLSLVFDGKDYSNINLTGISLKGLVLTSTKFVQSNLTNSDWENSNVKGCDFTNSVIKGSNLLASSLRTWNTL